MKKNFSTTQRSEMAQSANDSISDVSFEDIDVSIIQQVKQAIQRFAKTLSAD